MCLFVVAHQVSERFPLVIGANRDEDHERPTIPADYWNDSRDVVGGRDALHGGSWLALHRNGRFAAVTNIRGGTPRQKSRGFLVRDFVLGGDSPDAFIDALDSSADQYAAFHLVVGVIGGTIVHYSNAGLRRVLESGVHGVSNAPPGEDWEKVAIATREMSTIIARAKSAAEVGGATLALLGTRTPAAPIESQLFVVGNRYGTRASTAIVASQTETIFIEQNFARAGVPQGDSRRFRI